MKADYSKIYEARNRVKNQRKIYTYEAVDNIAKAMFPGLSLSEFYHYAGCLALGKCGVKLEILKNEDRIKIIGLHRAIATFV